jgi:hypothetical protein
VEMGDDDAMLELGARVLADYSWRRGFVRADVGGGQQQVVSCQLKTGGSYISVSSNDGLEGISPELRKLVCSPSRRSAFWTSWRVLSRCSLRHGDF